MSIIRSLQSYLETYEGMEEVSNIKTYTPDEKNGYALAAAGNRKVSEDILGNKIFTNQYTFLARETASDEVDRGDKQDFLEDFADWLDEQNSSDNLPILSGAFKAQSLSVSNAFLFDISEDGTGLYQVQITLKIKKEVA